MQELWNTMRRSNLRIINTDESEESQVNGIDWTFNKIVLVGFIVVVLST